MQHNPDMAFEPDSDIPENDHPSDGPGVDPNKKPTQRDLVLDCAKGIELWHDPDGETYATVTVKAHKEHHRVRSRVFRSFLSHAFYVKFDGAPSAQAMEDALRVLEAKAKFDGREHIPAVRVGEWNGIIYLDCADENWNVIEITPSGWDTVAGSPVRFIRPRGLRPLPVPVAGGSVDELRQFVNVKTDDDFRMLVAWVVMGLKPRGPFPILFLCGEHGAAKSTAERVLRNLIDPSAASLRSPPREGRDLLIAARNAWCIGFDNLSRLPEWLADGLCQIATGAGYAARQLYSDAEEIIFEAMRPILLNGIPNLAVRGDVADRTLPVTLPQIPKNKRRSEKQFWADFNVASGRILGALLTAVSCALRREDGIEIHDLPRMADFALWVTAAEPALGWKEGSFMAAYRRNLDAAVKITVEADPVADAILNLVATRGEWNGTASELLAILDQQLSGALLRTKEWPKAANALSGRVTRAAPSLRATGIDVADRRVNGRRHFTFTNMEKEGEKDRHHRHQSPPERGNANNSNTLAGGDDGGDPSGDGGDGGDADNETATTVSDDNPLSGNDFPDVGGDGGDGGDDLPSSSPSPDTDQGNDDPLHIPLSLRRTKPKGWETDL